MPNLKYLAEELGTDVETLRQVSTIGDYPEDFRLNELQEANVRNSFEVARNAGQLPTAPAAEATGAPEPVAEPQPE
jgi:hypothetical protein